MTITKVVCPDCGFSFEVRYPEGKPPAALTSPCGKCGGQMQPEKRSA